MNARVMLNNSSFIIITCNVDKLLEVHKQANKQETLEEKTFKLQLKEFS